MNKNFFMHPDNLRGCEGIVGGLRSGLMTGIAADADVYGFRNIGPRPVAISSLGVVFGTVAEATAAGSLMIAFYKVVGFSAIHPTGTPVTGNARLKQLSFTAAATDAAQQIPLTEISMAISGTAAISGATYTATDADEPFAVASGSAVNGVTATTGSVAINYLWECDQLPLVLKPNEGIVGRLVLAMPTALSGRLTIIPNGYRLGFPSA